MSTWQVGEHNRPISLEVGKFCQDERGLIHTPRGQAGLCWILVCMSSSIFIWPNAVWRCTTFMLESLSWADWLNLFTSSSICPFCLLHLPPCLVSPAPFWRREAKGWHTISVPICVHREVHHITYYSSLKTRNSPLPSSVHTGRFSANKWVRSSRTAKERKWWEVTHCCVMRVTIIFNWLFYRLVSLT